MTLFAVIETRWLKLPPNVRGILWLVMGTLAFSINDLFVKSLGKSMSPFQMAFFRYGIGFLIMAPVFLRMGAVGLKTSRPGIHGARLVIACIAQVGVYTTVVYLPLADATALAFSRILFTTIVAVIVLREVVSGGRWTATCRISRRRRASTRRSGATMSFRSRARSSLDASRSRT